MMEERDSGGKAKGPQRQEWGGVCSGLISEKTRVAAISQCAERNRSQESLCRQDIYKERGKLQRTYNR